MPEPPGNHTRECKRKHHSDSPPLPPDIALAVLRQQVDLWSEAWRGQPTPTHRLHRHAHLQHRGSGGGQEARWHRHPQRRFSRIVAAIAQNAAMRNQVAPNKDLHLISDTRKKEPPKNPIRRNWRQRQLITSTPRTTRVDLVPKVGKCHST